MKLNGPAINPEFEIRGGDIIYTSYKIDRSLLRRFKSKFFKRSKLIISKFLICLFYQLSLHFTIIA